MTGAAAVASAHGVRTLSREHALLVLAIVLVGAAVLLPLLGRLTVLLFIGAGGATLLLAQDRLRAQSLDVLVFLGPCLVAVASAVTSLHPQVTLWYGLQYAWSALVFFALAISLRPLVLMRIAAGAIWVGLLASLAAPAYHHVGHTGEIAFVGIFESKNNYSFIVGILVVLGAGTSLVGRWPGRLFGLASLALGFAFLLAGRSLGAIVGASAAVAATLACAVALGFHRHVLAPALVAAATLALFALALVVAEFDWISRQMHAVGRDPTLTGRTVLWQVAWERFTQAPLMGVGYRGFFVPHYAPATEILSFFHLPPGSPWHFHNAFFDVLAETGLLGVAAHALLAARILSLAGRHLAAGRLRPADAVLAGIFGYLTFRAALEVDFTREYGLGLFLLALVHGSLVRGLATRRPRQSSSDPGLRRRARNIPAPRAPSPAATGARASPATIPSVAVPAAKAARAATKAHVNNTNTTAALLDDVAAEAKGRVAGAQPFTAERSRESNPAEPARPPDGSRK